MYVFINMLTELQPLLFLPLGGEQIEILNSDIPEKDVAPKTPTSTQFALSGKNLNYI